MYQYKYNFLEAQVLPVSAQRERASSLPTGYSHFPPGVNKNPFAWPFHARQFQGFFTSDKQFWIIWNASNRQFKDFLVEHAIQLQISKYYWPIDSLRFFWTNMQPWAWLVRVYDGMLQNLRGHQRRRVKENWPPQSERNLGWE